MSNTHRSSNPGFRSSRLSQAIQGILLASALTASVAAHGEETTNRKSYHISGGSLGQALSQFARDAGILFTGESALTDGKTSKGLDGEYTVEEGFRKLLAGSGLTYTITDDNAVAIKIAEPGSDAASTLPAVRVVGKAVYDSETSYNPVNATTGTKTDAKLFDTPMSVQVVPKAIIDDQQATGLSNVVKNVSGVQQNFGFGFSNNESLIVRGFDTSLEKAGDSLILRDGFFTFGVPVSLANIDRVEVLKGPAAMLYGKLEPGGLVNVVTKRPQSVPYYSLQQQFGSFDTYRTLLDATGPATKDGSLSYRFDYEHLDSGSFRNFGFNKRDFIAPTVTWNIEK